MPIPVLRVENLCKTWALGTARAAEACDGLTFDVNAGELAVIIGPSGCGKSTLLSIICGLEEPTSGCVRIDGKQVTGSASERQLIFQDPSLYEWLSVIDNVAIGLKFRGMRKRDRYEIAHKYIRQVGLLDAAKKYPHELSGGMKQRVAIARALCLEPRLILMDEPFASLDVQTRFMMQKFLLDIWGSTKATILFVTHHIDEAIYIADRVIVLSARPGRKIAETPILLPRPRDITSKEFDQFRSDFFAYLSKEVAKSFTEQEYAEVFESTFSK